MIVAATIQSRIFISLIDANALSSGRNTSFLTSVRVMSRSPSGTSVGTSL